MAKVRVPKELRPPSRFKTFLANPEGVWHESGTFRVKGVFREPKHGEYLWTRSGNVLKWHTGPAKTGPRVILERVK